MSITSQRKGRAGELELVRILNSHGYHDVAPGMAVSYGSTPDVTGMPGIHIEVKRVERLNIHEAMQQATRDAVKFGDGLPAVFHRKNRCSWLVTMNLSDWLRLYERNRET
jgi:Holliday junction resolvase